MYNLTISPDIIHTELFLLILYTLKSCSTIKYHAGEAIFNYAVFISFLYFFNITFLTFSLNLSLSFLIFSHFFPPNLSFSFPPLISSLPCFNLLLSLPFAVFYDPFQIFFLANSFFYFFSPLINFLLHLFPLHHYFLICGFSFPSCPVIYL